MALTTLDNVKLMLGITGTSQDAVLTSLINSASARIEKWCNRSFGEQDCIEWKDGGLNITAKRTPLKKINRITVCDGTTFNVKYEGADKWATIEVTAGLNDTAGSVVLVSETVGVTTIALTGTVSDLLTAISAVSGWSAYVDGQEINCPAAWVAPMAGQDATVDPSAVGNGGGPVQVPVCIGEVSIARYDWNSGVIQLNSYGVLNGAGFGLGGGYGWNGEVYDSTPMTDGFVKFPRQFRGVMLDYTGGMNPIPDDVQQTCVDLVQMMLQSSQNSAMLLSGESLGGYSYTNAGGAMGPAEAQSRWDNLIRDRLIGYKRMAISD